MKILPHPQGSSEWHAARLGMVTGTRVKDALGASSKRLMDTLIAEKLTAESREVPTSPDMQRGIDEEGPARRAYEEQAGHKVERMGLCLHEQHGDWLGLSPDGLVKKGGKFVGGVEIKCPTSAKHVEYLRIGRIPAEYRCQVMAYFLVCESLQWVDFVSFDPRVQLRPLHVLRIHRADVKAELQQMMRGLLAFHEKHEEMYSHVAFDS